MITPRVALIAFACVLGVGSVVLFGHRREVRQEIGTMVAARADAVDGTADAILLAEVDRVRLALEQARGEPARDAEAHLALSLSDGVMTLERGDIVFRTTTVTGEVPRGVHTVEAVEERRIVLSDGIALRPSMAADSSAPPSRELRIPSADFHAIRPNLKPGQSAFFF
jgi:hypothetical protein